MNMFAQTKTILTPTFLRERMAPPAPAKLDLRHGVILYLEDINVSFDGFKALNNLNLYINKGELRCIIGPNGAGKSTMMDVITGKTRPDTGSAWFGQNINLLALDEPAIAEAGIGRKFQKPTVFEPLTVEENLELAMAGNKGVWQTFVSKLSGEDRDHLEATLLMIGLVAERHRQAGVLSHGQKQWLEIGMLLVQEPKLLLLDEPTAGVDPKARRDFWEEIHTLAAEGMTVLVSTHYMDEAERCHEIAYISYGRLIARGTADQVIASTHLITLNGEGPGIDRLSVEIGKLPGVDMAAPFGQSLHVSGTDRTALEAALAPYRRAPFRWSEVEPSLEDVFIRLMETSEDNFR